MMTQAEKLVARLQTLDASSLYEIVVYVTPDKTIGFWVVEKKPVKLEGEQKPVAQTEYNQAIAKG
jgi:hypothetical protein